MSAMRQCRECNMTVPQAEHDRASGLCVYCLEDRQAIDAMANAGGKRDVRDRARDDRDARQERERT